MAGTVIDSLTALAELELAEVEVLDHLNAGNVCGCEEPEFILRVNNFLEDK
jgi:hypothetical protein